MITNLTSKLRNSVEFFEKIPIHSSPENIDALTDSFLQQHCPATHESSSCSKRIGLSRYWLGLLTLLNKELDEAVALLPPKSYSEPQETPPPPPDLISIRDYTCVYVGIELALRWGVHPYLEECITDNLRKRPLPKAIKVPLPVLDWGPRTERFPSAETTFSLLSQLVALLKSQRFLPLFAARYLNDVLAGFLHLKNESFEGADQAIHDIIDRFPLRLVICSLRQLLLGGKKSVPRWLKGACGKLLTQTLLKDGGLDATIDVYLGGLTEAEDTIAISKLTSLLSSPSADLSPNMYLSSLGPQIRDMLQQSEQKSARKRVTAVLVGKLCESMNNATCEHILKPIFRPLLLFYQAHHQCKTQTSVELCSEQEVRECLTSLLTLVTAVSPLPPLIRTISELNIFFPLIMCYFKATQCKAGVLMLTEQCCLALLKWLSDEKIMEGIALSLCSQERTAFFAPAEGGLKLVSSLETEERFDCTGQTTLISMLSLNNTNSNASAITELGKIEVQTKTLVQLLEKVNNESPLPGVVFVGLLRQYIKIKENEFSLDENNCKNSSQAECITQMGIMLAVGILSEEIGARVLKTGLQVINILGELLSFEANKKEALLKNFDAERKEKNEDDEEEEEDGLLPLALNLLATMLEMGSLERPVEEENALRELLPSLTSLSSHKQPGISDMAQIVQAKILTRGLTKDQHRQQAEREKKLAEESFASSDGLLTALSEVQSDLQSDMVPLRARGIVTLTKLIRKVAFKTLDVTIADKFILTFTEMLKDTETYVYLAAVQGLSVLCNTLPGFCIPKLASLFNGQSGQLTLVQRIKVGEALLFAARRCGEALPVYADQLVQVFILGARTRLSFDQTAEQPISADDLNCQKDRINFRGSCLSNLAEVCSLLRWSLGVYVQRVFDIAIGILQLESTSAEEAVLVRRGAVFILYKILAGIDTDGLVVIGEHLKKTYRCLQYIESTDSDALCRYNARLAVACIDDIMRRELFSQSMRDTKKNPESLMSIEFSLPSIFNLNKPHEF